jgi:hypothetical protein
VCHDSLSCGEVHVAATSEVAEYWSITPWSTPSSVTATSPRLGDFVYWNVTPVPWNVSRL